MDLKNNKKEQIPWEIEEKHVKLISPKAIKITAVMIFIFIAISACAAAFYFAIDPEPDFIDIVEIEQLDENPISLIEFERGLLDDGQNICDLYFSNIEYRYKVILENGKELILSPGEHSYDTGSDFIKVKLDAYFYKNDLGEIILDDEGNAALTVEAKVYRRNSQKPALILETENLNRPLAEQVIKSIKPVSKNPIVVYQNSSYINIEGHEFEIIYGDGRTVRTKAVRNQYFDQTVDGNTVRLDEYEEDNYYITCGDYENYEAEDYFVKKAFPFKKIEITDCEFDEGYNIKSLSYKITEKDGTVTDYKRKPEFFSNYSDCYVIDNIKGYNILAYTSFVKSEADSSRTSIKVNAESGFVDSDSIYDEKIFPMPETDCECICHSDNVFIRAFIDFLKRNGSSLVKEEKCFCGASHYFRPNTYYGIFYA